MNPQNAAMNYNRDDVERLCQVISTHEDWLLERLRSYGFTEVSGNMYLP